MNDDVASQTNLLALNAAIEAARAGEQAAASSEQVSAGVEEATTQIGENTAKPAGRNGQVETLQGITRLVPKRDERMELYRQDAAAQEEAEQRKKAA